LNGEDKKLNEEEIIAKYKKLHPKSYALYQEYLKILPGGVAAYGQYKSPFPIYFSKAKGSRIWDVDGNEYIDTHAGYGPLILGHNHPVVLQAIEEAKERGLQYGAPSELIGEWAKIIIKHVPSIEMIRFLNSGSEAINVAVRIARAYTNRVKVGKIEGCYHGSNTDWACVSVHEFSGTPENPEPAPHSLGVYDALKNTIVLPFNDPSNAERIIEKHADELACVLMEPISGTGLGFAEPTQEYVKTLREVTSEHEIPLIFDEIMVGFRYGNMSCAQGYLNVKPDITVLGKVIGGGAPVGAVGGRKDIMDMVNPTRGKKAAERVYQSGTFCGNPFTASVGLATLKYLDANENKVYSHINGLAEKIRKGLKEIIEDLKIPAQVVGNFSTYEAIFEEKMHKNLRELLKADSNKLKLRDIELINRGVFKSIGHFAFTCLPHTNEDVEKILNAYTEAFKAVS